MKSFVTTKQDLILRGALSLIAMAAAFFLMLQLVSVLVWLLNDWFINLIQVDFSPRTNHALIHKFSVLVTLYLCGTLSTTSIIEKNFRLPSTLMMSVQIAIQAVIIIRLIGFFFFIATARVPSTQVLDLAFSVIIVLLLIISTINIWRYTEIMLVLSRLEFPSPSGKTPSRKYVTAFIISHAIIMVLVLAGLSLSSGLLSIITF